MLSRQDGTNYLIQDYLDEPPYKLDIEHTENILKELDETLEEVRKLLERIYREEDYNLYNLIDRNVFHSASMDMAEGRSWRLECMHDDIRSLSERLRTHQDDIPQYIFDESDNVITLEEFGYRTEWHSFSGLFMEKTVEDSYEREIVEEIILTEDKEVPERRRRIVEWEHSPGVKSSKSIVYEPLEMTEELMTAFRNTMTRNSSRNNRK